MEPEDPLRAALRHLFNSEFEESLEVLKKYVAECPEDPLGYALSAAVPFYHFVGRRLRPHGASSIKEMIVGRNMDAPPDMRQMNEWLQQARRVAKDDEKSLLALSIVEAIKRDALGLFHKRWMPSLQHAKAATTYARQLLEKNAQAYDAYYIIGFSEYVIAQVPGFIRPFAKIPGIAGQKSRAIEFLEAAARSGRYMQDFARQMLVTIYLEERRTKDAVRVLEGLKADFPDNAGYRTELERLT
jgi:hypothetical protein